MRLLHAGRLECDRGGEGPNLAKKKPEVVEGGEEKKSVKNSLRATCNGSRLGCSIEEC
jgi:hypothetical protein